MLVADPDAPAVGRQWVARSWATTHPWGSGRVYPNFPDPELANWLEAYYAGNYERLLRVKRAYDPDNLLRFAEQSLGSLPADDGGQRGLRRRPPGARHGAPRTDR